MTMTYMQAIGIGFPNVQCHADGEGNNYETIIWDAGFPLPSKETLDTWILSNDVEVEDKKITVLAFRNRFTLTEKVTLEMASIDNSAADMTTRSLSATLRVIMKDMETAIFIDLGDPKTQSGVQMMEQYQLITAGRSNEILNNPISPLERPIQGHT